MRHQSWEVLNELCIMRAGATGAGTVHLPTQYLLTLKGLLHATLKFPPPLLALKLCHSPVISSATDGAVLALHSTCYHKCTGCPHFGLRNKDCVIEWSQLIWISRLFSFFFWLVCIDLQTRLESCFLLSFQGTDDNASGVDSCSYSKAAPDPCIQTMEELWNLLFPYFFCICHNISYRSALSNRSTLLFWLCEEIVYCNVSSDQN